MFKRQKYELLRNVLGLSDAVIKAGVAQGKFVAALTGAGGQTSQTKLLEVLPILVNPINILATEQAAAVQNAQLNTAPISE